MPRVLLRILVLLGLIVLHGCAIGTREAVIEKLPTPPVDSRVEQPDYFQLIDRIKAGGSAADFDKLRTAYTKTSLYEPYGSSEFNDTAAIFLAMQANDYQRCLAAAKKILAYNYTSLNAHYGAMACSYQIDDRDNGDYHKYVLQGLLDSIGNSGDGQTPETAFRTISTGELQAYLQLQGLLINDQALVDYKGRSYDLMGVADPVTGKEFELYFDIGIQMRR